MTALETFEPIAGFEWDDQKNRLNLLKHQIDFDEASEVFYQRIVVRQSGRNNEERWLAVGQSGDRLLAVAFTRRGGIIRIISARRARKNEERDYRNQELGRPPEG